MKHLPAMPFTMPNTEPIYDFNRHLYAKATSRVTTVILYTWRCPSCKHANTTRKLWDPPRTELLESWPLESRCGHCHGQKIRLLSPEGKCYQDIRSR